MLLTVRTRAALLAAAAVIMAGSAIAAEPTTTTEECIAASESGQALRHAGKLLEARPQFAICVAESCPGPIREDCASRLDEIGNALPSVVFEVSDSAGNHVSGVVITIDGRAGVVATGSAVELDPGEHTFTVEAPGLNKVTKRLALVPGSKQRREVVIMDREESPRVTTAVPLSPATETPAGMRPPPTLALVAFGVGGAGLVVGVTAGLVAGSKHSSLEDVCDNKAGTCPPAYSDDLDSFETWRSVSTVGYVFGALGAAGGAVLWFTAPKERDAATTGVWLGPSSAGVAGRF